MANDHNPGHRRSPDLTARADPRAPGEPPMPAVDIDAQRPNSSRLLQTAEHPLHVPESENPAGARAKDSLARPEAARADASIEKANRDTPRQLSGIANVGTPAARSFEGQSATNSAHLIHYLKTQHANIIGSLQELLPTLFSCSPVQIYASIEQCKQSVLNTESRCPDESKLLDAIECYILHQIYPKVSRMGEEGDYLIASRIAIMNVSGIKPEGLELDLGDRQYEREIMYHAGMELVRLAQCKTPLDKLGCIVQCQEQIMESLSAESIAVDSLLPWLIWLIIKINPPRLVSSLAFVERFRRGGDLQSGRAAYCFTNMEAATAYIANVEFTSEGFGREEGSPVSPGRSPGPLLKLRDDWSLIKSRRLKNRSGSSDAIAALQTPANLVLDTSQQVANAAAATGKRAFDLIKTPGKYLASFVAQREPEMDSSEVLPPVQSQDFPRENPQGAKDAQVPMVGATIATLSNIQGLFNRASFSSKSESQSARDSENDAGRVGSSQELETYLEASAVETFPGPGERRSASMEQLLQRKLVLRGRHLVTQDFENLRVRDLQSVFDEYKVLVEYCQPRAAPGDQESKQT